MTVAARLEMAPSFPEMVINLPAAADDMPVMTILTPVAAMDLAAMVAGVAAAAVYGEGG